MLRQQRRRSQPAAQRKQASSGGRLIAKERCNEEHISTPWSIYAHLAAILLRGCCAEDLCNKRGSCFIVHGPGLLPRWQSWSVKCARLSLVWLSRCSRCQPASTQLKERSEA